MCRETKTSMIIGCLYIVSALAIPSGIASNSSAEVPSHVCHAIKNSDGGVFEGTSRTDADSSSEFPSAFLAVSIIGDDLHWPPVLLPLGSGRILS
jgi:hypothetical protein